jgi:hypothetical protein
MPARSRKRAPLPKPVVVGLCALASVLVFGAFMWLGRTTEANWGIESAFALADGNLLLVERAGLDNSTYDSGRLRIVSRSGQELRRSQEVEMAMKPHAVVDGGVWVDTHEGGLELWTLSELTPRAGAKAALAGAPALANRRQIHGAHEGKLVLTGGDDRHYTIDSGYVVEQQPKGFHRTLPEGVPLALVESVALDRTDLVRPRPLLAPAGGPLTVGDGKALVVVSSAQDGSARTTTLSRVDTGGLVRWSVTAEQLATPHELGDAAYSFPLVDVADGVVFVIAQATSLRSSSSDEGSSRTWAEHEVRLVDLDPEDGRVLSSRSIVAPEQ